MKKQLPLLIVVVAGLLAVGLYFGYQSLFRTKCDGLFEQTADQLRVPFEVIKTKGELVLGRTQVQALTEGSQKVALHLKACCLGPRQGAFDAGQFQACLKDVNDYEARIVEVSRTVSEAQTARASGNAQLAAEKTAQAKEAASAAVGVEKDLGKRAAAVIAATVADGGGGGVVAKATGGKGGEQEENNTVFVANAAEMGKAISGEIAPANDIDVFKFQYKDSKNRRDVMTVRVENPTPTLHPSVRLHNEDKSVAKDWSSPNAAGADHAFTFVAEPGKTYYVAVASHWQQSTGKYVLSVVPQKAYDAYEPNDDAFTATAIKVGQSVEANIMDGPDLDWYRVSGVKGKTLSIVLENLSRTLNPAIRVHNADKSMAKDWTATNAAGADLTVTVPVETDKDYYVVVSSHWQQSAGKYKLSVR